MNNTVTLSQLIMRLSSATGVDPNTSRRFLRAFFDTLEENLANGETIQIKNFGTFRRRTDDLNRDASPVVFIPDEAVSKDINRPFEMFEAVELADGADFSEVDTPEVEPESETVVEAEVEPEAVAEVETVVEPEPIATPEPEPEASSPVEEAPKPAPAPAKEEYSDPLAEYRSEAPKTRPARQYPQQKKPVPPEFVEDYSTSKKQGSHKNESRRLILPYWAIGLIFIAIACIGGWITAVLLTDDGSALQEQYELEPVASPAPEMNTETEVVSVEEVSGQPSVTAGEAAQAPAEEKAAPAEPAKPEPAKVYDTVEKSLSALATKHYGNSIFWVYIYEANRDIIKNPNAIRPGTQVVIPDKSTFSDDLSVARKKQTEIESQGKKK